MGFRGLWVAAEGMSMFEMAERLGFTPAGGELSPYPEGDAGMSVLPNGWAVVDVQKPQNQLFDDAVPLLQIGDRPAVACSVNDTVMYSHAEGWDDGYGYGWHIHHNSEKGLEHLQVLGDPPKGFIEIRDDQLAKQRSAEGNVDYLYDVPFNVAELVVGYRHDRSDAAVQFERLVPIEDPISRPSAEMAPEVFTGRRWPWLLGLLVALAVGALALANNDPGQRTVGLVLAAVGVLVCLVGCVRPGRIEADQHGLTATLTHRPTYRRSWPEIRAFGLVRTHRGVWLRPVLASSPGDKVRQQPNILVGGPVKPSEVLARLEHARQRGMLLHEYCQSIPEFAPWTPTELAHRVDFTRIGRESTAVASQVEADVDRIGPQRVKALQGLAQRNGIDLAGSNGLDNLERWLTENVTAAGEGEARRIHPAWRDVCTDIGMLLETRARATAPGASWLRWEPFALALDVAQAAVDGGNHEAGAFSSWMAGLSS